MTLARISLALATVAFAGFGLAFLLSPQLLEVVEVHAIGSAGRVELRGFYGGLELGLAAFFGIALLRPAWFPPALLVQALALGGLAFGRLAGLAVDGLPERSLLYVLAAMEASGALFAVVALLSLYRRGGQARAT